MRKTRQEGLDMVRKTLQGIRCPAQVAWPFVEALKCISDGKDITITGRVCHHVAAAIEDQRRMGQHIML